MKPVVWRWFVMESVSGTIRSIVEQFFAHSAAYSPTHLAPQPETNSEAPPRLEHLS